MEVTMNEQMQAWSEPEPSVRISCGCSVGVVPQGYNGDADKWDGEQGQRDGDKWDGEQGQGDGEQGQGHDENREETHPPVFIHEYSVLGEFIVRGQLEQGEFWSFIGRRVPPEAFVCSDGVIHIKFEHGYSMDITVNKIVRLINPKMTVIVVLNPEGNCSSLAHPTSSIVQSPIRTGLVIRTPEVQTAYFSLVEKNSILLCNSNSEFVHKLGEHGLSSSQKPLWDVSPQLEFDAFLHKAKTGGQNVARAREIIHPDNINHWVDKEKNQHYELGLLGMTITQLSSGGVRAIFGQNNEYEVKNCLVETGAKISSPGIDVTATASSCGKTNSGDFNVEEEPAVRHLFIHQGRKRIHFGNQMVTIRYGTMSAKMNVFGSISLNSTQPN